MIKLSYNLSSKGVIHVDFLNINAPDPDDGDECEHGDYSADSDADSSDNSDG